MKIAFATGTWYLSILLIHSKNYPVIKLPTEDEIKAMLKEAHQRFKEAIRKAREQAERREK